MSSASASSSFDPSLDAYALESDGDLELRPTSKPPAPSPILLESAALLTLWSLLTLNDGAVRFIDPPITPSFRIPHLAAAICELLLALSGLLLALPTFLSARPLRAPRPLRLLPALQSVVALFALSVFVFAEPAAHARSLEAPLMQALSLGESRFLLTLAILSSLHLTLALLGGTLQFSMRLLHPTRAAGARKCALLWNANMAAAGAWTLATGIFVRVKAGSVSGLREAFVAQPHVGRLPGMTGWTGVVLMFWAAVGVIVTLSKSRTPKFYFPGCAYVFLAALLNFAVVQPALVEGVDGFGGVVARQVGLAFVVVFVGPYFVELAAREVCAGREGCSA